eukprot:4606493-Pyramimonas_sp.AAC.1
MGHAIALRSGPRQRTTLDITGPIQCKAPRTLPFWGWTSRHRASAQSLQTTRFWQVSTWMACQKKNQERACVHCEPLCPGGERAAAL